MNAVRVGLALAMKDLRVAWSYKLSFIFGHVAAFGSLIVFYFVSKVIGASALFHSPDEYFRFIVIGMIGGALIEQAVGATMGAARTDQVQGTLESVAALPVGGIALGLGWLVYPMVDAVIGVIITLLLALPLGMDGADPNFLSVIVVGLLSVITFAGLGFMGTGLVLAFQQGAGIVPFALAALALVSGVMFPVEVLPSWLRWMSSISPLTHSLDAFRAAMLDNASLSDVGGSLVVLAGFAIVTVPLGMFALEMGLRHARRVGGLSRF